MIKQTIEEHILKLYTYGPAILLPFILILLTGCATIENLSCLHGGGHEQIAPSNTLQSRSQKKLVTYQDNDSKVSRDVYRIGTDPSKPPVILLHELPGPSIQTFDYAKSLSTDFTVYIPIFFGKPNEAETINGLREVLFNGEWGWPLGGSDLDSNTPIVKWLREVAADVQREHKGSPIGVIGNCLTGSLPLLLLDNVMVNAVVVAQPTLPIRIFYYSQDDRWSLGISKMELNKAKQIVNDRNMKVYGVRFENDCVSKPEKRYTLWDEFGDRYIDAQILESEYATPNKCPAQDCDKAHSTLIWEWNTKKDNPSEQRRKEVREYLKNPSNFSRRPRNEFGHDDTD